MDVKKELSAVYPSKLVDALLDAYKEIESNFFLGRWKASELDAGHFVEASRRIIEHQLFGKYTAVSKSLPNFSDAELKRYENAAGDDSYRLLIPRILKAIYNVRNKRGAAHLGEVSPNEMDSTYILYSVKWVLAEFVRLASGADTESIQEAIAGIVERRVGVLWKHGDVSRVMYPDISARDQVLILLYDNSPQTAEDLQSSIEYRNTTNFRKILKRLHSARLIDYGHDGSCVISPKGQEMAEELIKNVQQSCA